MKEQLYTIPVNDAFQSECECPLCKMKKDLERNAIEYTLGPSYMEDDNRAMTDEAGALSGKKPFRSGIDSQHPYGKGHKGLKKTFRRTGCRKRAIKEKKLRLYGRWRLCGQAAAKLLYLQPH